MEGNAACDSVKAYEFPLLKIRALCYDERVHKNKAWAKLLEKRDEFMSVSEMNTVDMAEVLTYAYEIGDMINASVEVADYLYWKQAVEGDPTIQALIRKLDSKKELFEETQRFGHFHPNYHSAKDEVAAVEAELEAYEPVARFKQAEKNLDDLLHSMSEKIAFSVSESIKVPGNDPLPKKGCGSGGACSCG